MMSRNEDSLLEADLQTFRHRLELCLTRRDLERLHDWLCRSVPVSERKPWLDELNVREEQLLARWYDEKRYL
ncbi:TPA: hypothetical protein OB562_002912 [Escherichia coli]|nr:hypothetical protein [Escherichia coli]HCO7259447.1 hypothetical protein [Escherichia coli]HEI3084466.1 hypothetical protein [Escherichia coli]